MGCSKREKEGATREKRIWLHGKPYYAFLVILVVGVGEKGRKRRLATHSPGLLDQAVQEKVDRVSIKVLNALIRSCVTLCLSWSSNKLNRRSRKRIERQSGEK